MVDIKREYWSCNGETVLKKSKFDQDVANTRAQERSFLDGMAEQATRNVLKDQYAQRPAMQPQVTPQPLAALPPAVRSFVQLLTTPLQAFATLMQALPNPAQTLGNALQNALPKAEQAIAQIFTFFFGNKKDEKTAEEKDKRNKNDFAMPDLFGNTKVESSANANLGGGGK